MKAAFVQQAVVPNSSSFSLSGPYTAPKSGLSSTIRFLCVFCLPKKLAPYLFTRVHCLCQDIACPKAVMMCFTHIFDAMQSYIKESLSWPCSSHTKASLLLRSVVMGPSKARLIVPDHTLVTISSNVSFLLLTTSALTSSATDR